MSVGEVKLRSHYKKTCMIDRTDNYHRPLRRSVLLGLLLSLSLGCTRSVYKLDNTMRSLKIMMIVPFQSLKLIIEIILKLSIYKIQFRSLSPAVYPYDSVETHLSNAHYYNPKYQGKKIRLYKILFAKEWIYL